jgi:rubrerythrin
MKFVYRIGEFFLYVTEEVWQVFRLHLRGETWVCPDCGFRHIQTPDRWQYCPTCRIETGSRVTMRRRDL